MNLHRKRIKEKFEQTFQNQALEKAGHYIINHDNCPFNQKERKQLIEEWNIVSTAPNNRTFTPKQREKVDKMLYEHKINTAYWKAYHLGDSTVVNSRVALEYLEYTNNHKFLQDPYKYWIYAENDSKLCQYYNGYNKNTNLNRGTGYMLSLYTKQNLFGQSELDAKTSNALINVMPKIKYPSSKRFIAFEDKVFDGETFKEFEENDYIIPRHHFKFKYDPNATLTQRANDELMAWASNDPDTFTKLIECIGYTMFPNSFKIAVWLIGYSNSGKSTFINEIIRKIHGNQTSSVDLTIQDMFKYQSFIFSTLNITNEPEGDKISSSEIKKIVGGDPLSVKIKGRGEHQLQPEELPAVMFNANHLSKTRLPESVLNKMAIISFKHVFDKSVEFEPFSDEDLQSIILVAFNHILKHKKKIQIANLHSPEYAKYVKHLSYSIHDYVRESCRKGDKCSAEDSLIVEDFLENYKHHKNSLQIEPLDDETATDELIETVKKQFGYYNCIEDYTVDGKSVGGFRKVKFIPFKEIPEFYNKNEIPEIPEKDEINYDELDEFEKWVFNQNVPIDSGDAKDLAWAEAEMKAYDMNYPITEEKYWEIWERLRNGPFRYEYTDAYMEWLKKHEEECEQYRLETDIVYRYEQEEWDNL